MKELNPAISDAIQEACKSSGQSTKVASKIIAWFHSAAGESLSEEEKAQRIGLMRDELELESNHDL